MGGQVFNQPGANGEAPLTICRLTPSMYTSLRERLISDLAKFYRVVVCPHEAGKEDHGDVDLLVEGPLSQFTLADIAISLGAERAIERGPGLYSLAVLTIADDPSGACAQLDIHVCSDNIGWLAFMQSHGDMWQIIGVAIRGYGFTATDKGFHVRVAEMEECDWKASKVFLGKEPADVLDFLGLDKDDFECGFTTERAFFEWLSQCRLFDREVFANRADTSDARRRMKTRGMYRRFIENVAPTLPDSSMPSFDLNRTQITHDAVEFFGRRVEYQLKTALAIRLNEEDRAWKLISDHLQAVSTSKNNLNSMLRGFKRWVSFQDKQPFIRLEAEMTEDRQWGFATMLNTQKNALTPEASNWILLHRQMVQDLEQARVNAAKAVRAMGHAAAA